ncbi:unnamed protein product [Phaeothamnion confervicola]
MVRLTARLAAAAAACLAAGPHAVAAFYLPGVAPRDFEPGERVEVKVNKLTSVHTQLPMDYYSMPFCKPKGGVLMQAENLGEFLTGDRIENSPYKIYMRHDQACKVLCQEAIDAKHVARLKEAIKREYRHNWIVDNLPAASIVDSAAYQTTSYSQGFPVGYEENGHYYLYNHVRLLVDYHPMGDPENPSGRVVGFFAEPFSVAHRFKAGAKWDGENAEDAPPLETCAADDLQRPIKPGAAPQEVAADAPLLFTYDVVWQPSQTKWASRWDIYLTMDHAVPNKVR